MSERSMWMVRAGQDAYAVNDFEEHGVVAIGWGQTRCIADYADRQAIVDSLTASHPEMSARQRISAASQIDRFRDEISVGDDVVTYDPGTREYLIGVVSGEPAYKPELIEDLANVRGVTWNGRVSRDALSVGARNSLGAIQTLFRLPNEVAVEIKSQSGEPASRGEQSHEESDTEDDAEEILDDLVARSHEFIKDRLSGLPWDDMERLIAGLLRAMGYKTRMTTRGSDRGSDIVASPDGFGFEQPRIVAEVKHRNGKIGAEHLRGFIGGRHKDDKGLYVSTGGFSRDARYEAERATIPITLMDLDDLVSAVVEYYDLMDGDTKALVRLRRLYWPA